MSEKIGAEHGEEVAGANLNGPGSAWIPPSSPDPAGPDKSPDPPNWVEKWSFIVLVCAFFAALYAGVEANRLANLTHDALADARLTANTSHNDSINAENLTAVALGQSQENASTSHRDSVSASKISSSALISVQRAFVFIDTFHIVRVGDRVQVSPEWKNSGTTPTAVARSWVNWKTFNGDVPKGFSYPDINDQGRPVSNAYSLSQKFFIAPGGTASMTDIYIPVSIIEAVQKGALTLIFWGWVRYRDVFGVEHTTHFGAKAIPVGDGLEFPEFGSNNCADAECRK